LTVPGVNVCDNGKTDYVTVPVDNILFIPDTNEHAYDTPLIPVAATK